MPHSKAFTLFAGHLAHRHHCYTWFELGQKSSDSAISLPSIHLTSDQSVELQTQTNCKFFCLCKLFCVLFILVECYAFCQESHLKSLSNIIHVCQFLCAKRSVSSSSSSDHLTKPPTVIPFSMSTGNRISPAVICFV